LYCSILILSYHNSVDIISPRHLNILCYTLPNCISLSVVLVLVLTDPRPSRTLPLMTQADIP